MLWPYLLGQWDVVGWVTHSSVNWSTEQLLGRLGHLDMAVMTTNLPLLRGRIKLE